MAKDETMTQKERAKSHYMTPPVSREGLSAKERMSYIKLFANNEKNPEKRRFMIAYYSSNGR